jgi:hypothetical protein
MITAVAAAVLLAAGCGTSSSPTSHSSSGGLSPMQAITLAANQARQVTSFSSTLDMKLSGTRAGTIAGTFEERTQPSQLVSLDMNTLNVSGRNLPGGMQEVMTGSDIYMKMSLLSQEFGKPWVLVPYSALQKGTGINFGRIVQQAESNDPLVQTQMFTSAKDAHVVGTQTVDGVATTHYAGTYPVAAGIAKLPASLRTMVTNQVRTLGIAQVSFNAWIDAQHQIRKIQVAEPGRAESVAVTMQVTGIGQQVNIALPAKSEVANLPATALKGIARD